MELDRRQFLKYTGIAIAMLTVKPVNDLLLQTKENVVSSEQKTGDITPKRLAMVIDTRLCPDGCTDCIDACHYTHNVPDFTDTKDEIKWLSVSQFEAAFPDVENQFLPENVKNLQVLTLCNHCDNPPCVRVCPTQATWKRADGVVMMDYHRCIGCRYCMAACPYGARSFNWRDPRPFINKINQEFPTRARGVVEKCNFCEERLAEGQIPACVEACKAKALIFGDLDNPDSEVSNILRTDFSIQRKPGLGTKPQVYYIVR